MAQVSDNIVPGLRISMANNEEKNIEDIRPGDKVVSYDIANKKLDISTVGNIISTYSNGNGDDFSIIIEFADGTIIHDTSTHPYWVDNKGYASYRPDLALKKHKLKVAKLDIGDNVCKLGMNDISPVRIKSITKFVRSAKIFELVSVSKHSNYFANGILVHNIPPDPDDPPEIEILPGTIVPGLSGYPIVALAASDGIRTSMCLDVIDSNYYINNQTAVMYFNKAPSNIYLTQFSTMRATNIFAHHYYYYKCTLSPTLLLRTSDDEPFGTFFRYALPFKTSYNISLFETFSILSVGAVVASFAITTAIDSTKPAAPAISYDKNWTNKPVTITASASDSGSGLAFIQHSIDDVSFTQGNSAKLSANGKVFFQAVDRVGNISESSIEVSNIDLVSPTCVISVDSSQEWTNQTVTARASGNDEGSQIAYFEHSTDEVSWVNGDSMTFDSEGTAYFRAVDNAGNVSRTEARKICIDKAPPIFNANGNSSYFRLSKKENAEVYSAYITLKASDDLSGISKIWKSWDNCEIDCTSGIPKEIELGDIAPGSSVAFSLKATDKAGNVSEEYPLPLYCGGAIIMPTKYFAIIPDSRCDLTSTETSATRLNETTMLYRSVLFTDSPTIASLMEKRKSISSIKLELKFGQNPFIYDITPWKDIPHGMSWQELSNAQGQKHAALVIESNDPSWRRAEFETTMTTIYATDCYTAEIDADNVFAGRTITETNDTAIKDYNNPGSLKAFLAAKGLLLSSWNGSMWQSQLTPKPQVWLSGELGQKLHFEFILDGTLGSKDPEGDSISFGLTLIDTQGSASNRAIEDIQAGAIGGVDIYAGMNIEGIPLADGIYEVSLPKLDKGIGNSASALTDILSLGIDTLAPSEECRISLFSKDRANLDFASPFAPPISSRNVDIRISTLSDSTSGIQSIILWNATSDVDTNIPPIGSEKKIDSLSNLLPELNENDRALIGSGNALRIDIKNPFIGIGGAINIASWILSENDGKKYIRARIVDLAGNGVFIGGRTTLDTIAHGVVNQGYDYVEMGGRTATIKWQDPNKDTAEIRLHLPAWLFPSSDDIRILDLSDNPNINTYKLDIPTNCAEDEEIPVSLTTVDFAGNESSSATLILHAPVKLGTLYKSQEARQDMTGVFVRSHRFSVHGAGQQIIKYNDAIANGKELAIDVDGSYLASGITSHASGMYRLEAKTSDGKICDLDDFSYPDQGPPHNEIANFVPLAPPAFSKHVDSSWLSADSFLQWNMFLDPDNDPISYEVFAKILAEPSYTSVGRTNESFLKPNWGKEFNGKTILWFIKAIDIPYSDATCSGSQELKIDLAPPSVISTSPGEKYLSKAEFDLALEDGSGESGLAPMPIWIFAEGQGPAGKINVNSQQNPDKIAVSQTGVGKYHIAITGLDASQVTIQAIARDLAGNEAGSTIGSYYFDKSAPQIASVSVAGEGSGGVLLSGNGLLPLSILCEDSYSGVRKLAYGFSDSPDGRPTAWRTFDTNRGYGTTGTIRITKTIEFTGREGITSYLIIKAIDWAGNESLPFTMSDSLFVDRNRPSGTLTVSGPFLTAYGRYLTEIATLTASYVESGATQVAASSQFAIVQDGLNPIWMNSWNEAKAMPLTAGTKYHVECKLTSHAGLDTILMDPSFSYDPSAPTQIASLILPSLSLLPGQQMRVKITALDSESGISRYGLAIGRTKGSSELSASLAGNEHGWLSTASLGGQGFITLSIPDNAQGTYYLSVYAENAAGLRTTIQSSAPELVIKADGGMVVRDEGPFTTEKTMLRGSWQWTGTNAAVNYEYRACIEGGTPLAWRTTSDKSGIIDGLVLTANERYWIEARPVFADGSRGEGGSSLGVKYDGTAPVLGTPAEPPLVTPRASTSYGIKIGWAVQDDESGIGKIEARIESVDAQGRTLDCDGEWTCLGNTAKGTNMALPAGPAVGTAAFTTGTRAYVRLRVTNGAGISSEIRSEAIAIDDSPPPVPVVVDQGEAINCDQPLEVQWIWTSNDPESGTEKYEWALLESPQNLAFAQWRVVTSEEGANKHLIDLARVATNSDGKTWYFALRATNGAGLTSIGLSDGIVYLAKGPYIAIVKLYPRTGSADHDINYSSDSSGLEVSISASPYNMDVPIVGYRATGGNLDAHGAWQGNASSSSLTSDTPNIHFSDPGLGELIQKGVISVRGEASHGEGLASCGYSSGLLIDPTPPVLTGLKGAASVQGLDFDWSLDAGRVPITSYEAQLKRSLPGSTERIPIPTPILASDARRLHIDSPLSGSYILLITATNAAGVSSRQAASEPVYYDTTPPSLGEISMPAFVWPQFMVRCSAVEPESMVTLYEYALGNEDDLFAYSKTWMESDKSGNEALIPIDLSALQAPVPEGERLVVTVRARNSTGLWSAPKTSLAATVDRSAPKAVSISAGKYSTRTDRIGPISVRAEDEVSGIRQFRLAILGKEVLGLDDASQKQAWTNAAWQTVSVPGGFGASLLLDNAEMTGLSLHDGGSYIIALQAVNNAQDTKGAGQISDIVLSGEIRIDATFPSISFAEAEYVRVLNDVPASISYTISEDAMVEIMLTLPTGEIVQGETGATDRSQGAHSFDFAQALPGVYTVWANLADLAGNRTTNGAAPRQLLRVNAKPNIMLPDIYTTPGQSVAIESTAYDPDESLYLFEHPEMAPLAKEGLNYRWDFGDGSANSILPLPRHIYSQKDAQSAVSDYILTLTVTDADGGSSAKSAKVRVANTTSGTLYVDEIWNEDKHYISGDVIVPAGVKLTIADATEVRCLLGWDGKPVSLKINGTLFCGAADFDPVENMNRWEGIQVSGQAIFEGTTIRNAARGVTALNGSTVTLSGCDLIENSIGLHASGSNPKVKDCHFSKSAIYAIKEDSDGDPTVCNCDFSSNLFDYYDESFTILTAAELNSLSGNSGNIDK